MVVVAVGMDHESAPVEVREEFAFDSEQAKRFLSEVTGDLSERLLLSTCNRTEFLAVTPWTGDEDPAGRLVELLYAAKGGSFSGLNGYTKVYRGADAVRHLFRVAAGIESMVLGETQIVGQVKDAGELAEACGAAGPVLRRVLSSALRVAKRARTETRIGEGAVSVASAAVELAKRIYGDLGEYSALVVGAGETGRLAAQHLRSAGIGKLLVANRTLNRAVEVAGEVEGEPWGLCGVPPGLRQADIVVTSTGADEPVLTYNEVKSAMRARKGRMLAILDIAVPRDVELEVARLENVFLHDIDALRGIVDQNLELRRKAVPKVEEIVDEAVERYLVWEQELGVVPTIRALRERFEEIRMLELAKNLKRVPPEAREQAARLTESLVSKLLHEPTIALRKAAKDKDEGKDLTAFLRRIFGIDGEGDE